eukprot:CAMPEP_0206437086 /NCGR_PEP_ID=MMETSP0324_2-20121206/10841_1 /ASSEMBLY_ACC=CAM_ASM_000836 /TAXON_ID=2866 /ORGANISM="Crypthecodinium cohnii, Strain Seligo" /LENGTH=397 /DNA_ID=CAMNT_0053904319 /DNA_START=61 /DNA_END=1254 /DNA_ORIENTATION=-
MPGTALRRLRVPVVLACCLATHVNVASGAAAEPAQVRFMNEGKQLIDLYWKNDRGGYNKLESIEAGQMASQESFTGHVFMLEAADKRRFEFEVLRRGDIFCEFGLATTCFEEWEAKKDKYKGPEWEAIVKERTEECQRKLKKFPEDAEHFCSAIPHSFVTECQLDYTPEAFESAHKTYLEENQERSRSQPAEFKNFTKVGFKVMDIEPGLLKELRSFWHNNRLQSSHVENHGKLDGALSGCQSDTWVLHLYPSLKQKVHAAVRDTLAEWSGVPAEDLEATALYGLRFYREGSILNTHVDRSATHVISCILEIGHLEYDYEEADADKMQWPLKIFDHDGVEHTVPNRVGQMILYESATCAHGRPDPFPGREFVNAFVHFSPKGWPENYLADPGKKAEL